MFSGVEFGILGHGQVKRDSCDIKDECVVSLVGEFVIESIDGARHYTFSKFEKIVTGCDDLRLQSIEGLLPNFLSTSDIDVFE